MSAEIIVYENKGSLHDSTVVMLWERRYLQRMLFLNSTTVEYNMKKILKRASFSDVF